MEEYELFKEYKKYAPNPILIMIDLSKLKQRKKNSFRIYKLKDDNGIKIIGPTVENNPSHDEIFETKKDTRITFSKKRTLERFKLENQELTGPFEKFKELENRWKNWLNSVEEEINRGLLIADPEDPELMRVFAEDMETKIQNEFTEKDSKSIKEKYSEMNIIKTDLDIIIGEMGGAYLNPKTENEKSKVKNLEKILQETVLFDMLFQEIAEIKGFKLKS